MKEIGHIWDSMSAAPAFGYCRNVSGVPNRPLGTK